uniref:Ribosomal protein L6 n=1 Tax=Goniomonas avonlea TaxID=1255295 RepID=A0A348G6P0_9CRYP|nr:ribosomal protein L6 [Goniomonas avonlea]
MNYFISSNVALNTFVKLHFIGVGFAAETRVLEDDYYVSGWSLLRKDYTRTPKRLKSVLGFVHNPVLSSVYVTHYIEKKKKLIFHLGYSHLIHFPECYFGVNYAILQEKGGREKNTQDKITNPVLVVSGKQLSVVHDFASQIRKCCLPSVYTDKGIKFSGEIVRKKQSK